MGQAATVVVPVNGSVESAIKAAVAEFQSRHKGQLPSLVLYPRQHEVGFQSYVSWMVRRVTLVKSDKLTDAVRAA